MARDVVDLTPIEGRDALVTWLEQGIKPSSSVKIGTEHEKIPFYQTDGSPVPYGGARGIEALLRGMQKQKPWEPIEEHGFIIGLYDPVEGGGDQP